MNYGPSGSSGTDDNLLQIQLNKATRGHIGGNERVAAMANLSYARAQQDMESQIHFLEREAYSSVLRAFKAQSDAITWEKEGLITELRKELRVSDDEHRELLTIVNADEIIQRIREWRQAGGIQSGFSSYSQPVHNPIRSPSVSVSRKKQKTTQLIHSMAIGASAPVTQPQAALASVQPTLPASKRTGPLGFRGKKSKPGQSSPGASLLNSADCLPPSVLAVPDSAETTFLRSLIGRKVLTKWPEDNNFYKAEIADYNPIEGRHSLVYDRHTESETWEWVNLKEIPPNDILWEGEDPAILHVLGHGKPGYGNRNSVDQGVITPGPGRGRGTPKIQINKDIQLAQNGCGGKGSDNIELFHTDILLKQIERIFSTNRPDPLELEKAKKALRNQERSLIDAIARLGDTFGCEHAGDGDHRSSHGPSDREKGWGQQREESQIEII